MNQMLGQFNKNFKTTIIKMLLLQSQILLKQILKVGNLNKEVLKNQMEIIEGKDTITKILSY
jgi:hypothetical protein